MIKVTSSNLFLYKVYRPEKHCQEKPEFSFTVLLKMQMLCAQECFLMHRIPFALCPHGFVFTEGWFPSDTRESLGCLVTKQSYLQPCHEGPRRPHMRTQGPQVSLLRSVSIRAASALQAPSGGARPTSLC